MSKHYPKGEQTRQKILEQAAQVFSVYGYAGTSLDALMQATHLTKGGIYNHFGSKEALAVEALDYAIKEMQARFWEYLTNSRSSRARLLAVVQTFRSSIDDPRFAGGCILLNTAVEADDTNPPLKERAQQGIDDWLLYIKRTIHKGIELGTVRPDTNAETVAGVMIATLEGATMLAKLYDDPTHMYRACDHITEYIESFLQENPT